jgi:O-antigen ligase
MIVTYLIFPVLFFVLMFVGNAQINGNDLFHFVFFPAVLLLLILFVALKKINLKSSCIVFTVSMFFVAIFALNLLNGIFTLREGNYQYYYWPIQALTLFMFLIVLISSFNFEKSWFGIAFLLLFSFFSIPTIIDFILYSDRVTFIFGPNVLYKVLAVLAIFSLFYFRKEKLISLVVVLLLGFSILATGSRTGLLVIFLVLLYYLDVLGYLSFKRIFLLIVIMVLILVIGSVVSESRLFLFDTDTASVSVRFIPWNILLNNPYDFIFGLGLSPQEWARLYGVRPGPEDLALGSEGLQYPHNIFLELIFYYGFIGFLISLFLLISVMLLIKDIFKIPQHEKLFVYVFFTLFIAAFFSGDLKDNYALFGILFIVLWMRAIRKAS